MNTNTTADGIEALAIVRGLRERIRELEADKARLDWLEAEGGIRKDLNSWTAWGDKGVGNKTELRAAIDAARNQQIV